MFDLTTLISEAKEACDYVYDLCPFGSSNRQNGNLPNTSKIANQSLSDAKENFADLVAKIESNSTLLEKEKPFEIIKLLANVGEEARAGNCQEMAAIAFLFLLNLSHESQTKRFKAAPLSFKAQKS